MRHRHSLWFAVALLLAVVTGYFVISTGSESLAQEPDTAVATRPNTLDDPVRRQRLRVTQVDFLGEVSFPTGTTFGGTEVGGLSGLTYDAAQDRYFALSDDRGNTNPARFYELQIDLSDGSLDDGDITFVDVVTLLTEQGMPFAAGSIDPEGIALSNQGTFFTSSEGDTNAQPVLPPFVNEFNATGQQIAALPVPPKFLPAFDAGSANLLSGVRNNLAFESLTLTPDNQYLYTAVEDALAQDGPTNDRNQTSLSRIIKYDLGTRQATGEFVYVNEGLGNSNGLVELVALDNNGTLLGLERLLSRNPLTVSIRLYEVQTQGALDVQNTFDLFDEVNNVAFEIDPAVQKRELLNFSSLVNPDNLEAMTLGPTLPDGRQVLIVASDNNFVPIFQRTQFIALALTLEAVPAALPTLETPSAFDAATLPAGFVLSGTADDPAIWSHPDNPAQSQVFATLEDGGLVRFNMAGQVRQLIAADPFGSKRLNNVDLVYSFPLSGTLTDLAVASDQTNDTLAIFAIDPNDGSLSDVTATDVLTSIFGVDAGGQTAYGLATYRSPVDGRHYAFVTQANGAQVAQLLLSDNGTGKVAPEVVRTLNLPTANDSQAGSLVADREMGYLYVAIEGEVGVLKYNAEPTGGQTYTIVQSLEADYLSPGIDGLTIYYGSNGSGYLLVSSQGDGTYAIFDRAGSNAYLGSVVIGDNGSIDQANKSDGADVLNVNLGPGFASGVLVVQDAANDPQFVVQNEGVLENRSTNFKFVPWENVANAFSPPLHIEPTGFDPRNPRVNLAIYLLYLPLVLKG